MKTLLVLLASGVSALAGTILEIQPQSLATVPATFNGSGRVGYYTNADPAGRLLFVEFATKPGYGYTAYYSFAGPGKFVLQKPIYTETTNTMERLDFFPPTVWVQVVELPPVVTSISVKYSRTWLSNGWYYVEFPVVAGQTYLVRQNLGGPPTSLPFMQSFTAATNGLAVVQSQGGFPMAWVEVHPTGSYPMPPPSAGGIPLQPEVIPTLKTNTIVLGNKYPPVPPPPRINPRYIGNGMFTTNIPNAR